MSENQKTALLVAGICVVIVAVIAIPLINSDLGHRSSRLRLDDPNPAVRVAAIRATGREGYVDVLANALQDEKADVRLIAAMYLQGRGSAAAPITQALISALKDEHAGVRRQAAEALSAIGAPAAPPLVKALSDPNPFVRAGAALGLSDVAHPKDFRRRSPEERALVIPALEKLLTDESPEVRRNVQKALKDIGGPQ
jgi:HEAT repeat protein